MSLRFHWMMPKGGEVGMKTAQETSRVATTKASSPAALPDMEGWETFARCAEEAGIEGVLLSFSRYEPDTIFVACAVGPTAPGPTRRWAKGGWPGVTPGRRAASSRRRWRSTRGTRTSGR